MLSVIVAPFFAVFSAMLRTLHTFVPQAYAACDATKTGPGTGTLGINLTDCFMLNATTTVSEAYKSPAALLNLIVTNVFIASGFVIMGMIMVAGFQALSGSSKGLEQAKKNSTQYAYRFLGDVRCLLAHPDLESRDWGRN
jgi:hypothetical protein